MKWTMRETDFIVGVKVIMSGDFGRDSKFRIVILVQEEFWEGLRELVYTLKKNIRGNRIVNNQ